MKVVIQNLWSVRSFSQDSSLSVITFLGQTAAQMLTALKRRSRCSITPQQTVAVTVLIQFADAIKRGEEEEEDLSAETGNRRSS